MGHIQDILPELEKRGARAVVILAEKLERIREYLRKKPFPFPVLSDARRTVVKEYGVYVRVNFESVHIARPANFVLDSGGIIRYIFIASIQTEYPPDEEILAAIDEAAG
ncbi:MAG: redoxin domain-containing protein [Actinobacteria bacterium]|nr:redoxin domain-containing protein [Actinomycetota bacterium]